MQPAEYERMYALEESYWWFQGRHDLVLRALARRFPGRTDLAILDLGCGTGAMSCRMRQWGEVVSADISPIALSYSRRRGVTSLTAADAMRLPFRTGSFDAVVALDILEHLPDDGMAASEIMRVLKPGGAAIITVPAYQSLWSGHDLALMHHRRYVAGEVGRLLSSAGANIERLTYAMTFLYPAVWLVRRLPKYRKSEEATLVQVPEWANSLLAGLLRLENALLGHCRLPFGVTVFCVAHPNADQGMRKG